MYEYAVRLDNPTTRDNTLLTGLLTAFGALNKQDDALRVQGFALFSKYLPSLPLACLSRIQDHPQGDVGLTFSRFAHWHANDRQCMQLIGYITHENQKPLSLYGCLSLMYLYGSEHYAFTAPFLTDLYAFFSKYGIFCRIHADDDGLLLKDDKGFYCHLDITLNKEHLGAWFELIHAYLKTLNTDMAHDFVIFSQNRPAFAGLSNLSLELVA